MNIPTYEGYSAAVEFDAVDGMYIGHIAGINDIVGFHASSIDELQAAFRDAVDDYVNSCGTVGKKPDRPNPGNVRA